MKLTVAELAEKLGAELAGNPDIQVSAVADLENAREETVVWVEKRRFLAAALESPAAAIIAGADTEPGKKPVLRVANPRLAYARSAQI
nr:LpxD N-terminal domain-containing protein [bacterium]